MTCMYQNSLFEKKNGDFCLSCFVEWHIKNTIVLITKKIASKNRCSEQFIVRKGTNYKTKEKKWNKKTKKRKIPQRHVKRGCGYFRNLNQRIFFIENIDRFLIHPLTNSLLNLNIVQPRPGQHFNVTPQGLFNGVLIAEIHRALVDPFGHILHRVSARRRCDLDAHAKFVSILHGTPGVYRAR